MCLRSYVVNILFKNKPVSLHAMNNTIHDTVHCQTIIWITTLYGEYDNN